MRTYIEVVTDFRRFGITRRSVLAFLLLVILTAFGRACIFRPGSSFAGATFNQHRNAVWLEVTWVNDAHSPDEIAALADRLRRTQISTVYVYTSYLKPDHTFNPTYSHAQDFVAALKAADPDVEVLAWIGLPLVHPRLFGGTDGHVDLEQSAVRLGIVSFCLQVVRTGGFDGVHLDPEPVADGNQGLLHLLDDLGDAFGQTSKVSIAAPKVLAIPFGLQIPALTRNAWRPAYLAEIGHRVDEVVIMTYDSGLPLPGLYQQLTRFQVVWATEALAGVDVDLLIGIDSAKEKSSTHWPNAETMQSGLLGTIDGLNDDEAHDDTVDGVAIYLYDQTDDADWATYARLWLGVASGAPPARPSPGPSPSPRP